MEMDAPLPDELEWLENASNAQFYEASLYDEGNEFDADDELLELCRASIEEDATSRKRPCAVSADVQDVSGGAEKRRCGVDGEGEVEKDGSLLQCSPRKGAADGVGEREAVEVVVEETIVSRFASDIDGDVATVTDLNGDRVYVKMCSGLGRVDTRSRRPEMASKGLLSEPIEVLMERLDDQATQMALCESFGSPSLLSESTSSMVTECLWVEKYAPSSFSELLSDEQTNREVLLWLKQWDSFVFGSRIRATTDDVLFSLRRHSSFVQHQKNTDRMFFSDSKRHSFENKKLGQSNNIENGDQNLKKTFESWSRKSTNSPPEQKVLLLCGPPGLGKTTLAHVAARHCGYRVVEINASDERSSLTIESKIFDVVQMNSVMADSKPKCLIIDEIDGALGEGKGAVEVILKMIAAEKKPNNEASYLESSDGKVHSKKRRKATALSRPVICICNDLYSPALRPLRQVAKVHTFARPTVNRLVNRLKYICEKEDFRTNSVVLSALAECTECDIRSCLNTLQFLHKKKENLNILDVDSQVVGRKDMSRTAFDVWKEVLQKRKSKQVRPRNVISSSADFEFLHNLISSCGEYELIADGIYENFLQLGYHDPAMKKTVACLNVLGNSDSLNRFIMRTQQMPLHAYQPFVAIRVKQFVAQVDRPHLEWPRSLQRCRTLIVENGDLFKCWHNKLLPSISRHLSMESLVHDIVSPLLHILSPTTLRPVALHLLSEREKDNVSQLLDIMVSYSITYKSSKEEPVLKFQRHGANCNANILTLHPPLDNFVKFKDHQVQMYELSSSTKEMLMHEAEKHKILCEGMGKGFNINSENKDNHVSTDGRTPKRIMNVVDPMTQKSKSIQDTQGTAATFGVKSKTPESLGRTSPRSSNFFDRFRKTSKDNRSPGTTSFLKPATIERDQRPFLLKYNEGFTNAIRRPVRMRELL